MIVYVRMFLHASSAVKSDSKRGTAAHWIAFHHFEQPRSNGPRRQSTFSHELPQHSPSASGGWWVMYNTKAKGEQTKTVGNDQRWTGWDTQWHGDFWIHSEDSDWNSPVLLVGGFAGSLVLKWDENLWPAHRCGYFSCLGAADKRPRLASIWWALNRKHYVTNIRFSDNTTLMTLIADDSKPRLSDKPSCPINQSTKSAGNPWILLCSFLLAATWSWINSHPMAELSCKPWGLAYPMAAMAYTNGFFYTTHFWSYWWWFLCLVWDIKIH